MAEKQTATSSHTGPSSVGNPEASTMRAMPDKININEDAALAAMQNFEEVMPRLHYVRRSLLPVCAYTIACLVLATIFEAIACASDSWASFDIGEKTWWGLWQACNSIDPCEPTTSPLSVLHISSKDVTNMHVIQATCVLCVLLPMCAAPFFFLAYLRSIVWGAYGHIVLAVWLIFWIVTMVQFGTMDIYRLLNAVFKRTANSDYFDVGTLMHITGLVLVFTASVIHWGSYIFCYTVDIYDDYGNLISVRQDLSIWTSGANNNQHQYTGALNTDVPYHIEVLLDADEENQKKAGVGAGVGPMGPAPSGQTGPVKSESTGSICVR